MRLGIVRVGHGTPAGALRERVQRFVQSDGRDWSRFSVLRRNSATDRQSACVERIHRDVCLLQIAKQIREIRSLIVHISGTAEAERAAATDENGDLSARRSRR